MQGQAEGHFLPAPLSSPIELQIVCSGASNTAAPHTCGPHWPSVGAPAFSTVVPAPGGPVRSWNRTGTEGVVPECLHQQHALDVTDAPPSLHCPTKCSASHVQCTSHQPRCLYGPPPSILKVSSGFAPFYVVFSSAPEASPVCASPDTVCVNHPTPWISRAERTIYHPLPLVWPRKWALIQVSVVLPKGGGGGCGRDGVIIFRYSCWNPPPPPLPQGRESPALPRSCEWGVARPVPPRCLQQIIVHMHRTPGTHLTSAEIGPP